MRIRILVYDDFEGASHLNANTAEKVYENSLAEGLYPQFRLKIYDIDELQNSSMHELITSYLTAMKSDVKQLEGVFRVREKKLIDQVNSEK